MFAFSGRSNQEARRGRRGFPCGLRRFAGDHHLSTDLTANPASSSPLVARTEVVERDASEVRLRSGALTAVISEGALRWLTFDGTEVVRGIAAPVRDANWATLPTTTTDEVAHVGTVGTDGFSYRREFSAGDAFHGVLVLTGAGMIPPTSGAGQPTARLVAELVLTARAEAMVNRAGFTVLHPLANVVGTPLTVRHADGREETSAFPHAISPGQPVRDVVGLSHEVDGVAVDIAFEGDIFEMEDQRNWTDASYKTYCRPLSLPRPFQIAAGERIEQRITISLRRSAPSACSGRSQRRSRGRMPRVMLAAGEAIAPIDAAQRELLHALGVHGLQVRVRSDAASDELERAAGLGLPIDLEVVVPGDGDPHEALANLAERCAAVGLRPRSVVALPQAYLASIQPEGPWPAGASPAQTLEAAGSAFPSAQIGAGVLTNFTELNRCPPAGPSDFVTFGTTAIVHAADDASVLETLEALPDVVASARALAGDRPLRLGLVSIGMRSNPYGAGVVANPHGERLAMAMDDPRQKSRFAAAFAVGALAAAAEEGVESLSLAMVSGPLGLIAEREGGRETVHPLAHVVAAAGSLAGRPVEVVREAGLVLLRKTASGALPADASGALVGLATNLADEPVRFDPRSAVADPSGPTAVAHLHRANATGQPYDWLAGERSEPGPLTLHPLDVAFVFAGEANP